MAQLGFTRDRVKSNEKLPIFNPDTGVTARLAILDAVEMRYVHNLVKPVVVNGRVKTETRSNQRGEYQVDVTEFVARFICLGDEGTLEDKGVDPKNCLACKRAAETVDKYKYPEERYALNVLRYATKPDGSPSSPLQMAVEVWPFTQKTYNALVTELTRDYPEEHIRDHDVVIEVVNQKFRNYKIKMAPKAAWAKDANTKALAEETLSDNRFGAKALVSAIARELTESQIEEKLAEVEKAWSKVRSDDEPRDAIDAVDRRQDLDNGLNSLPGGRDEEPATRSQEQAQEDDGSTSRRTSGRREPREDDGASRRPSRAPEPDAGETINFDDLLGSFSS